MKTGITVQKTTELAKLLPVLLQGRVFCCLKLNIFFEKLAGSLFNGELRGRRAKQLSRRIDSLLAF